MNITNASNKPRNAAKLAQEYKLIAEKKLKWPKCQELRPTPLLQYKLVNMKMTPK